MSPVIIGDLLRQEDIESLIQLGAPADEYSFEAREMARTIGVLRGDEYTEENIVAIMALLWARSFDLSAQDIEQRVPAFRRVVRQLLGRSDKG